LQAKVSRDVENRIEVAFTDTRIITSSSPFPSSLEKKLLCGGTGRFSGSKGTCLTQLQIDNAYKLYNETWLDGQYVYGPYLPGLEGSAASMNIANRKASGYTQLVVYKKPKTEPDFDPYKNITFEALEAANRIDVGKVNAANPDVSAFVKAGGKAILYHGTADLVASPVTTLKYFDQVRQTMGADIDKSMKMYLIPGMQHSRGGPGPVNFGAPTHRFCGNRPLKFDTDHDIFLALIAWAEQGYEPRAQIGATYESVEAYVPPQPSETSDGPTVDLPITDLFQNYNWGVKNTRLLCPYPLKAKYQGGPTTGEQSHRSFICA
jgi:hypothetical protein